MLLLFILEYSFCLLEHLPFIAAISIRFESNWFWSLALRSREFRPVEERKGQLYKVKPGEYAINVSAVECFERSPFACRSLP